MLMAKGDEVVSGIERGTEDRGEVADGVGVVGELESHHFSVHTASPGDNSVLRKPLYPSAAKTITTTEMKNRMTAATCSQLISRFDLSSLSNIENDKQITLNYLFSRYIFAETIEYKSQTMYGKLAMIPERKRIVFIFDKPSIESFRYVWSMSKHFQFNNGEDQITYAFYPSTPEDIKFTKDNFFNSIMNDIDHPMTAEIRAKSNIDFLRNRHISPVEY